MRAQRILDKIRGLKVLVLGDVCLDRWCFYDPDLTEPSRETGIPRIAVVRTETTPGAAGTIANNLIALGVADASLLGVIGADGFGWELLKAAEARGISGDLLLQSPEIGTFTYTKVINCRTRIEDQPRLDFVSGSSLPATLEQRVVEALRSRFADFDVIIVCDQAETQVGGVVTPAVRDLLADLTPSSGKTVWVDSRVRLEHFRNVVAKPNGMEAEQACLRAFGEVNLPRLRETCNFPLLVVTEGDRGARLIGEDGQERFVPGRRVQAVDICGAGDSFSAGAACALAATGDAEEAAWFGNLVASITVQKPGTGTASPEELLHAELDSK